MSVVREIRVFPHSRGIGAPRAVRIYRTYGIDAVQVMSEIRRIGFKTADAIAMKLGIDKTAMIRVRVGISYTLSEAPWTNRSHLPKSFWRCRRI